MFYIVPLWVEEPALHETRGFVFRPRRWHSSIICPFLAIQLHHSMESLFASVPLSDAHTHLCLHSVVVGGPPLASLVPRLVLLSFLQEETARTEQG